MNELTRDTLVADRYRLVHELGRGGMGAVWRAHHVGLNIPCAIKFILGEAAGTPEIRARFEQEAQAAAQLRSPHVVQILDHGLWLGTPYIAMELLEGEDLEHRLAQRGRLPLPEIAAVVAQMARALGKAHAAGLVHRDLKPANVFLCRDEDGEVVKILDFGIAKQTQGGLGGSQTKTGALLGTPYYMSPEQARGVRTVDYRSDLWSLAVIVFQCATGQLPFQSDAFGDLLVRIMFHPLPVPSQLAPLPPGFDAFWARAAAREPEARFQSARELAEALAMVAGISLGPGEPLSRVSGFGAPSVAAYTALRGTPMPGAAPPTLPSGGGAPTMGASTVDTHAVPPRRGRLWPVVAAVGLLAVGGAAGVLTTRGPSARPAPAASAERAAPAETAAASAARGPEVTPAPASAAPPPPPPAASASASASAAAPPAAPPPRPRGSARPVPAKPRYDDGI